MSAEIGSDRPLSKRLFARIAIGLERRWDDYRRGSFDDRPAKDFRIVSFIGHGADDRVVVRGRVVDNPEPPAAMEGESVWTTLRRNVARFRTNELPDVPLEIQVGESEEGTTTDDEGYFDRRFEASAGPDDAPWTTGTVRLAEPYRGVTTPHETFVRVRVPGPDATFGVVSDVDDTILWSDARNPLAMARRTLTGSALTRKPVPGAPELYRALAAGESGGEENPFFYVSSSAWNLHGFLVAFLRHRDFPMGPLMLRDLLGTDENRTHGTKKRESIAEVLELHPDLPFVLFGDSGQHDPRIYAEIARRNPDRILAVYIRDVGSERSDEGLVDLTDDVGVDVPFLMASDSTAIAEHAADLGILPDAAVDVVDRAVTSERSGPVRGLSP